MCRTTPGALGLALLLLVLAGAPARADRFRALSDPALNTMETLLAVPLGPVGPCSALLVESWRCWCLSILNIAEEEERQNMLAAITTYQMLGVMKAVRAGQAAAEQWFDKMRREMAWYEQKHPEFRTADLTSYQPPDAIFKDWFEYRSLRGQIEWNEKRLKARAQEALDAIATLRNRAAQGKFVYLSLAQKSDYLLKAMRGFQTELAEVEWWAEKTAEAKSLSGRDLRLQVENTAKDLVFFVQIAARKPDGSYAIRPDCETPIPLYPLEPPAALQTVDPKGTRGWKTAGFLVQPRDQLILRVATMGPVRDRIRFMPIKGRQVKPDVKSIQRNFWWLAYTADLPNTPVPLISRWASASELYNWGLSGGWSPTSGSPTKAELSKSNTRDLGSPYDPDIQGDQLSWVIPASRESCLSDGSGAARVQGQAVFEKLGPQRNQRQEITEKGDGWLKLTFQAM